MGYNMTEWQTGDVVTAEKINNMELGISNNDAYKAPGYLIEYINDGTNPEYLRLILRVGGIETLWDDLNGGANFLIHDILNSVEYFYMADSIQFGIDPSTFTISYAELTFDGVLFEYDRIENNAIIFIKQTT